MDKYRNDKYIGDIPIPEWLKPKKEGDRWSGTCCHLTSTDELAGVLNGGAVASSGFGDGCYSLYTAKEGDKIVAMKLVFIADDDENKDIE